MQSNNLKVCVNCGSVQNKKASKLEAKKQGLCLCGYDDPDNIWPEVESFDDDIYTDDGYDRDCESDYSDVSSEA